MDDIIHQIYQTKENHDVKWCLSNISPKEKENEDVSPAVNEVDDEVDGGSGEPGVVDED